MRNIFGSHLPMRRGVALFEGPGGIPVYKTPAANHYLTFGGQVITMMRRGVPEAVTTPFGAPLPPVPIIAPAPLQWRTPAHAIAAQQGNLTGLTGTPVLGSGNCSCNCKTGINQ